MPTEREVLEQLGAGAEVAVKLDDRTDAPHQSSLKTSLPGAAISPVSGGVVGLAASWGPRAGLGGRGADHRGRRATGASQGWAR